MSLRDIDADGVGPGVLHDVGQRLGYEEVGSRLDSSVESFRDGGAKVHGHGRTLDERLESGLEAALGEHGGVNAARQIPQLTKAALKLLSHSGQARPRGVGIPRESLLHERQLERSGHELLLRAVVEVALDAPARRA